MLFNSLSFLAFLPVVVGVYYLLPHRLQNRWLLLASYFFYGSWDWRFLGLIWISTIVDFLVGQRLATSEDPGARKRWLTLSVATNLGILGFFKYFDFFATSFAEWAAAIGWQVDPITLRIVLPVGISFYTFQTLSYTIDIYRRRLEPCRNFFDFALFVAFFPQLVAGPIERAAHFLPQVTKARTPNLDQFSRGLFLILLGFVKKVAIADGVATLVNAVYSSPEPQSALSIAAATFFFAVQIYGDFSGYSDIARGTAKLMGFELMLNFDVPYASVNPQEFWTRWHISLSTWLRDYLYIPLGGNRHGQVATYRNLMTTMVLGGLWHGAAWNFVLWGAYQGSLLLIHRAWHDLRRARGIGYQAASGVRRLFLTPIFFVFVCYGWLLFRAESLSQVGEFTTTLLSFEPGSWSPATWSLGRTTLAVLLALPAVMLLDGWTFLTDDHKMVRRLPEALRGLLYAILIFLLFMGLNNPPAEFIYFQF